jgi:hypothetical protein
MPLDRPPVPAVKLTRRELLRSSLALGAFVLPSALARTALAAPPRRRARGVILVLLEGGMSHLDTWDPKPNAPAEIRGEFGTIKTTVPELRIGEHMPLLAQQAHRFNLIRSVHCDARNDHSPGTHLVMTGWEYLAATAMGVTRQTTNPEHPSQGAIIARQLGPATANGVPRFVAIPARKHRVVQRTARRLSWAPLMRLLKPGTVRPMAAVCRRPWSCPGTFRCGRWTSGKRCGKRSTGSMPAWTATRLPPAWTRTTSGPSPSWPARPCAKRST